MKKIIFAIAVFAMLIVASCSKDKAATPSGNVVVCDSIGGYTYALAVKPILDNNCAQVGCHGTVAYQNNVQLHDFANAKIAFETKDALCSVKWECNNMPAAVKLSDSLITILECWQNNGYPQ